MDIEVDTLQLNVVYNSDPYSTRQSSYIRNLMSMKYVEQKQVISELLSITPGKMFSRHFSGENFRLSKFD